MLNASNKKMPHRHIFCFASADTVLSESGHDQYVSQFLPDRVHPCGPSYASPVELGMWSCSCTPGSWSSLRSSRADTWCAPLGSCNACSHVRSTGRWAAERRNQEFLDEEKGTRGKCCYDICWSEGGGEEGITNTWSIGRGLWCYTRPATVTLLCYFNNHWEILPHRWTAPR